MNPESSWLISRNSNVVFFSSTEAVMTGLRRVDSLPARCLLSRGRTKRAMVSRQKQEYQRQSRDVNNTRQGSRSQAQVQSSKVRQSRVKHRDGRKNNAQNVSQGKTRLRTGWVFVCCFYVSERMRCRCGEAIRVMSEWWQDHAWRRRKYWVSVYKLNVQILSQTPWQDHAWRRRKYWVSVYKLNVQILSQTPFKKTGITTQWVYGKTTMTDDFELEGEGESSVSFSTSLRQVWDTHRRTGEHLCVYKAYNFCFFKWAIVWLDKTLFIVWYGV